MRHEYAIVVLAALLPLAACAGRIRPSKHNETVFKHLADKLSDGHDRLAIRKIAVLPFSYVDSNPSADGAVISEKLITRIANEGELQIVERSLLAKVLEELRLQHSGIVDETSIKGLGKILGVEAVVAGTLTRQMNGSLEINARLIKTESAAILAVATGNVYPDWDLSKEPAQNITIVLPPQQLPPGFPHPSPPAPKPEPTIISPLDNSAVVRMDRAARWWPADGNSIEKYTGSQGVMVNGAAFAPGVIREAFNFDGEDDYIVVGRGAYYDELFNGRTPLTLSFFLNRVAASHHQGIFTKGRDPHMFSLSLASQGHGYQLSFQIKRAHNSKLDVSTIVLDHTPGEWEHWAVSYDGKSAAGVKIYRNGVAQPLMVHGDSLRGNIMTNSDPLEFGRMGYPLYWQLESRLDDVKFFTKELSHGDIAMLASKLQANAKIRSK